MIVHWTETATRHLQAIHDYVAQNSRRYAQALVDRITRRTANLGAMPFLGPEVPEYHDPAIREVLEYPYRIIFRVSSARIDILAVIHGARRLPRTPPIE